MNPLRLVVMTALLLGCDKELSEDSGTEAGGAVTSYSLCMEHCEYYAQGEGCDTQAVTAECDSLCFFPVDSQCLEAYQAMIDCEIDNQVSYVCDGSTSMNGVDWPYSMSQVCNQEFMDYSDCFYGM